MTGLKATRTFTVGSPEGEVVTVEEGKSVPKEVADQHGDSLKRDGLVVDEAEAKKAHADALKKAKAEGITPAMTPQETAEVAGTQEHGTTAAAKTIPVEPDQAEPESKAAAMSSEDAEGTQEANSPAAAKTATVGDEDTKQAVAEAYAEGEETSTAGTEGAPKRKTTAKRSSTRKSYARKSSAKKSTARKSSATK